MKAFNLYDPKTDQFVATIKVVKGKSPFNPDEEDDVIEHRYFSRLPVTIKHTTNIQMYNYLFDHFQRRCNCQHDCCGCYFGGVSKVKINGRHLMFTTSFSRNI